MKLQAQDYERAYVLQKTDDYEVLGWLTGERGIYCLHCSHVSFNKNDIERCYCAHCKMFHPDRWAKRKQ